MATIALYANKINQMSGLISSAKKAVGGLNTQLATLKRKCEKVNASVCNLDDVISSISASTQTQEEKVTALETFGENVDQFAEDTARIDDQVADKVNKNKEDFYSKYSYLKPDCEKSGWEKFCDGCKDALEWCKEHWEAIVTIVAAVVAAVVIIVAAVATLGAAAVVVAALIGAAVGLLGQLLADTISFITTGLSKGEWKWPGTWEDYVGAIFGGAVGGILMCISPTTFAIPITSFVTTLFTEGLKGLTGESSKSLGEMWLEATVDGLIGFVFGKAFDFASGKLAKFLSDKIPFLGRLAGQGSYGAAFKAVLTKLKNGTIGRISWKTVRNGVVSKLFDDGIEKILAGVGFMQVIKNGVTPVLKDIITIIPTVIQLTPVVPVITPFPGIRLLPMRVP